MSYHVEIKSIPDVFYNSWNSLSDDVETGDNELDILTIEDRFKKRHATLIRSKYYNRTGKVPSGDEWIWDKIDFDNENVYFLFLLEWS